MTGRFAVRTALLCLIALVACVAAAPVPKAKKRRSDAELLEGRWVGVTLDTGGGPAPATDWWVEIKDGKLSTGTGPGPANGYKDRAFKLDPAASPKHLDIDALNGQFHLSIYELDGDTLTWCETNSTTARPTELKGGKGGNCFVFKRAEQKDK